MSEKLAWGIIGTGGIAEVFAKGLVQSKTGYALAVASRSQDKADIFADRLKIQRRYSSYEALLEDNDVDAFYIATPHPMHAQWAVGAAEHGKHILCEKPLTMNYAESMAVIEAVKASNVFLMEGFMYRCHPQTAKVVEIIKEGVIGKVCVINAVFSIHTEFAPEKRWLNPELGGGAILDVGCYCVSYSRLIAGAAAGKTFEDPLEIKAFGRIGDVSGSDEYASALLLFDENIISYVSCGLLLNQESSVRIYGSEGSIYISDPWLCGTDSGEAKIVVTRYSAPNPQVINSISNVNMYAIEADIVGEAVASGRSYTDKISPQDSLGNMRALDLWRLQIGMLYDQEKPKGFYPTISRHPLTVKPDNEMSYSTIPGIDRKISRLVMGIVPEQADIPLPHVSIIYDDFYSAGGNAFHAFHISDQADALLGQWIINRDIRDRIILAADGADSLNIRPEKLSRHLYRTLKNLQTDYLDAYFIHYSGQVPVDEYMDILNEHHRAGHIKALGALNWPISAVEEANAYARSRGLEEFSVFAGDFSLMEMIKSAQDVTQPDLRAWLEQNQFPVFARFSLFAKMSSENIYQSTLAGNDYPDSDYGKIDRIRELAAQKGVEPAQITAAYVLCQAYPIFLQVAPRTLAQWHSIAKSTQVQLSSDELQWLNL